ncbi:hypothetical protein L1987_36073 [Smallanthus sonchifolius]|uniref:Uncharacterized protein n=1 Tax=Smallanthus sonchifolius TaxID=185202 RepID=A0ACB9HCG2_9ASTR|nr:hypothetical protein L1987_36073 [Smallanthus sonchifolius]
MVVESFHTPVRVKFQRSPLTWREDNKGYKTEHPHHSLNSENHIKGQQKKKARKGKRRASFSSLSLIEIQLMAAINNR